MKLFEVNEEAIFNLFKKRVKDEYTCIIAGIETENYINYYGDALRTGGALTRFIFEAFEISCINKYYAYYRHLAAEVFENNNLEVLKDESTK